MPLSANQIEARKRGVGGSEILAALGKDPRCSRLELYKRKVGELPELDFSDDQRVHFGNLLEPVVRTECARRLNTEIVELADTLFHPSAPLVGNPDGIMPALRKGLEIKMCDRFLADEFGEEETDQVPVRYLVQCQAYMSLTGYEAWMLAVLIGGNDLRFYEIASNKEIEAAVLAGVTEFWSHVARRVPPDPGTPDEVKMRWPKDLGTTAIATPDIIEACERLRDAKAALKAAEAEEEDVKATIQQFMQEHAQLVDSSGSVLATWRTAKPSVKFNDKKLAVDDPNTHKKYQYEQPGSRRFLLK